jgi:hypothetical protein
MRRGKTGRDAGSIKRTVPPTSRSDFEMVVLAAPDFLCPMVERVDPNALIDAACV